MESDQNRFKEKTTELNSLVNRRKFGINFFPFYRSLQGAGIRGIHLETIYFSVLIYVSW